MGGRKFASPYLPKRLRPTADSNHVAESFNETVGNHSFINVPNIMLNVKLNPTAILPPLFLGEEEIPIHLLYLEGPRDVADNSKGL